jgi:hypothetical protein
VLVLLLAGKVVEVVARHGEKDADAARDVVAIAMSLTCR